MATVTTSGLRRDAWGLAVEEERLTLRGLIRRRVLQEVVEHNVRRLEVFLKRVPLVGG